MKCLFLAFIIVYFFVFNDFILGLYLPFACYGIACDISRMVIGYYTVTELLVAEDWASIPAAELPVTLIAFATHHHTPFTVVVDPHLAVFVQVSLSCGDVFLELVRQI